MFLSIRTDYMVLYFNCVRSLIMNNTCLKCYNLFLFFLDIYDAVDTYCPIGNKSPSSQLNHLAFTFPGSTSVI